MIPDARFKDRNLAFWAHIKIISEKMGYSDRKTMAPRYFDFNDMIVAMRDLDLDFGHLLGNDGEPADYCTAILEYLNYRANVLEKHIKRSLMTREQAKVEFEKLKENLNPRCKLPMNKQKREKRHYAYMVGIVNMLTESALNGRSFDDDPHGLTLVIKEKKPFRTFSRWMDGAYPSIKNPIAVWEIKEYYGTTTFGSRVADGVYETLLDGHEILELYQSEELRIRHYLIVDDYYTWWECGRSYLCRIVDMLNMNYLDEVIFGREVLYRWPAIVKSWIGQPP